MSALQSGVSGMLAHQARMDAVGNNIANANTVGYKSERVLFEDALYQVIKPATPPTARLGGTNPSAMGEGVLVAGLDTSFAQGDLQATGRTTDIAIEGSGFLPVTDGSSIYYTRNGALGLDASGNLVHLASGLRVVALPAAGGSPAPLTVTPGSTLQIPLGQSSIARATSQIDLGGNLDSRSAPGTAYPVSLLVYDFLGAGHNVTLTFTRATDAGQWNVSGASTDGTATIAPPGQVTFDANGLPAASALSLELTLTDPKGADPTHKWGISLTHLTQLAQDSSAALSSQDGLPPGSLTGVSINSDGSIQGVYSNGLTSGIGQLVTALLPNTGGLRNLGNSLFESGVNSGAPAYGLPGAGGRGAIRSGQLESSNVNLAQEFADMIVTQRGFQASSRVVTTADQILQELINVGR